jgi:cytochrome o ubiquinol oxidase subunit IV
MSTQTPVVVSKHDSAHGTLQMYISGFVLSIFLTLAAYTLVVSHEFSNWALALAIAGLAIVQFLVQLFFFLHLGRESKPRWKLTVFLFMLLVVGILVIGSLWIMYNLNYRMAPTQQQIDTYMQDQDGGI